MINPCRMMQCLISPPSRLTVLYSEVSLCVSYQVTTVARTLLRATIRYCYGDIFTFPVPHSASTRPAVQIQAARHSVNRKGFGVTLLQ